MLQHQTATLSSPPQPPIVWSIAGTDSGGGAGLSADQRAADALRVHLCPVVAAVTAQNSVCVTRVQPVGLECLQAQLETLAEDMPPQAIKTGLLGNAEQVACVAEWVDRLRAKGPLALVVDPVLGASTGAAFANADTLRAYRELLLPRATLITPNQAEAAQLLGLLGPLTDVPAAAEALRHLGCESVCITGGDVAPLGEAPCEPLALDWIATPHASGWLAHTRLPTPHNHGTGCTFASAAAGALARGFVCADALVLAKMATWHALLNAQAAGQGPGPVRAQADFIHDPAALPRLSWGPAPVFPRVPSPSSQPLRPLGLYAVVDSADRLQQVLDAGIRTVQLRLKTPEQPTADWPNQLRQAIARCIACARQVDAELFINDHAELALELGAPGIHLGQEDLLALSDEARRRVAQGAALGISSHSLWELCRASTLQPRYIACGPVWPTTTKAMPWLPQGLDNLSWWSAMAPRPVVAIGGILAAEQVLAAARSGADGVCVVRGLGEHPAATVPALQQALEAGHTAPRFAVEWPHSSLVKPALVSCR